MNRLKSYYKVIVLLIEIYTILFCHYFMRALKISSRTMETSGSEFPKYRLSNT